MNKLCIIAYEQISFSILQAIILYNIALKCKTKPARHGIYRLKLNIVPQWGWSGGAMVLGKLPVPGRPTTWMIVEQESISLAVGAGGVCLDI